MKSTITSTTSPHIPAWFTRISWGAIFAGLVLTLALQILLSLLGIGIGMSTVDPATDANPMSGLGVGSMVWFTISAIVAMFAGGMIGGRLANGSIKDGMLHGLMIWALTLLMTFYLVTTTVGRVVSGVGSLIGTGLSVGGQAVAQAAPELKDSAEEMLRKNGFDLNNIRQEANTILRQTGKVELQPEVLANKADQASAQVANTAEANADASNMQQDANVEQLIANLFREGQDTVQAIDREAVVNVLVARGQTQEQANATVDRWIGTYQTAQQKLAEAKTKALQAADSAAEATTKAAFFTFFVFLLGAIAAVFGGRIGSQKNQTITTTVERV